MAPFMKKHKLDFPVLLETAGDIKSLYQVTGIPESFIIDKDGMIIARLVGIACEKLALNGLVKLHTLTGDSSKVQMASEQLSEIEKETEEIKRTAKEAEAKR